MNDYSIETSFTSMPEGEPFVCSFSGGKDSVIALSRACERGEARGVIHWFNNEQQISLFHHQNIRIIKAQADCMNLPLLLSGYTPWGHRYELISQYKKLEENGIKSIIFGDICTADSAKIQYILCKKAGLIPRFPLWGDDYRSLFLEMLDRKIKTIISRVNTAYLDESWLGKAYNEEAYSAFEKKGIDPFGERGEFHTTVISADIFNTTLGDKIALDPSLLITFSKHELKDNIYHLLKKIR
jgi:hypothetical protein